MKPIYIAVMLTLAAPPVLGATACATTRMAGEQSDDLRIKSRVGRRLTLDPEVKRFKIDVDTIDGVVTLRGKVDSETMKTSAEDIARTTNGVKDVRNELIVDDQGVGERIKENSNDVVIKTRVGTRFTADPDIDRLNIDIDVQDGVVTLSGVVHDETAKAEAEKVARGAEGVTDVKNELTVNPDDQRLRTDTNADGSAEGSQGATPKDATPETATPPAPPKSGQSGD
jgi:hyperosmotically inducible protein